MMRNIAITALMLCLLAALASCGTEGSANANVEMILSVFLTDGSASGDVSGSNNKNVDVTVDVCDAETGETEGPLKDHYAHIQYEAWAIAPEIQAGVQRLEQYDVKFFTPPGAPPIESYTGSLTYSIDMRGITNSVTSDTINNLVFMDVARKNKYYDDVTSGQFSVTFDSPPIYQVLYVLHFTDSYSGKTYTKEGATDFTIGRFLNCDTTTTTTTQ